MLGKKMFDEGMGLNFHVSNIFFTTLPKNNHILAGFSNSSTKTRLSCTTEVSHSMDRLLDHYEIESLRNTMLKHEEIFRNQLNELHRLYKIQKMLMAELRSKGLKLHSLPNATSSTTTDVTKRLWSSKCVSETSQSSQVSNFASLKELNICSKDPSRIQKTFDLEQPAEEHNSTDERTTIEQSILLHGEHLKEGRSIEGPHNWSDDENGIELTLGIGSGTDIDDRYVGAPPSKHQVG